MHRVTNRMPFIYLRRDGQHVCTVCVGEWSSVTPIRNNAKSVQPASLRPLNVKICQGRSRDLAKIPAQEESSHKTVRESFSPTLFFLKDSVSFAGLEGGWKIRRKTWWACLPPCLPVYLPPLPSFVPPERKRVDLNWN